MVYQEKKTIQVFHGSNSKFKEFSIKAKRVENDFFGGGIAYFTDDQKVALTYSRAMTYRYGGTEYLYKAELSLQNIFDVNHAFTGAGIQKFFAHIKPEDFARGAGLLGNGADRLDVITRLKMGNITMTGQEVFKGLSRGNVNSASAEKILKELGYDGLRYNGGDNMSAGRHNVYLPYYTKDIKILNVFKVNRKIIAESLEMPPIGLTFSRDLLPQIKNQSEFMDHLKAIGIASKKASFDTGVLRATQSDGFDMKKVAALMKSPEPKPVLVSSDGFILDGHHRWIAAFNKKEQIPSLVMDAPILELIRIAADYQKSHNIDYLMSEAFAPTEMINEIYGSLRTHDVLYHHFDTDKGVSILANDNLGKSTEQNIALMYDEDEPVEIERQSILVPSKTKGKIRGTSLTRNINLTYQYQRKRWILEFDRKKLRDRNPLHVIDADLAVNRLNPRMKEFGKHDLARNRAMDYFKNGSGLANEFAEEFLEGDLPGMHRCLRAIWLKDGPKSFDSKRRFYDILFNYSLTYSVPIKYFPSGKDAMADLEDWMSDEVEIETDAHSNGLRPELDRKRMSHVILGIKKSLNINKNRL